MQIHETNLDKNVMGPKERIIKLNIQKYEGRSNKELIYKNKTNEVEKPQFQNNVKLENHPGSNFTEMQETAEKNTQASTENITNHSKRNVVSSSGKKNSAEVHFTSKTNTNGKKYLEKDRNYQEKNTERLNMDNEKGKLKNTFFNKFKGLETDFKKTGKVPENKSMTSEEKNSLVQGWICKPKKQQF